MFLLEERAKDAEMWERKKADNRKDQEKKVTGLYFSLSEVVHWPGTVPLIIGTTLAIQNS